MGEQGELTHPTPAFDVGLHQSWLFVFFNKQPTTNNQQQVVIPPPKRNVGQLHQRSGNTIEGVRRDNLPTYFIFTVFGFKVHLN